MKNFLSKQENYIKQVINNLGYNVSEVSLIPSSRKEFGDYQYNGVMAIAKELGKNPREIALEIVNKLEENKDFVNVNVAGPGFINISFANESLINYLNEMNNDININYEYDNPKTIYLDYGGANVAKTLHVGHLRSANIGEALKRLANALGNKTISDVHLGDWGRPLGLVILEISKRQPDLCYFDDNFNGTYPELSPVTNEDLMEIYPTASIKAKEDENYLEEARVVTKKLQEGHKGYNELWKKILEVSSNDIKKIYDKLNTTFDVWEGESDCYKSIPEMLDYINTLNVTKKSEGAIVIDVKKETDEIEYPPFMLVKSNGGASYQTTDLAGIWQRVKKYNPDEIWYVADNRQSLHFETVFRAANITKIVDKTKLEFIGFGTMNGSDGKPFKTRDGGVMSLNNLIDLVKVESEKKLLPNIVDDRDKIAEDVAISAIKYADLIPFRTTDYVFDPVKFSDLNGKTGPYLLYSTIRMKSLLKKANAENIQYDKVLQIDEYTKEIVLNLLNINSTLIKSFNNKSLNEITELLYKITNSYNNFYSAVRILTETNEEKRTSWLAITKIVYDNNMKLLNILGINVPERM
jgi:arginyl-tRNA synthetase